MIDKIPNISQFIHNQFVKNETKLHELSYLFWECTQRCNLSCKHCGTDCSSNSSIKDMPFEHFLEAILPLKEKYKKDSITVVISGGEPLLRNDLAECGLALRQNGFRWGIVTNGFLYDYEMHGKLLAAGMGAITVSVDGLGESHNWLRGEKQSFSRAMQALDLISNSERLNYDVVTCVNAKNISELDFLKTYFISKKVKSWRLFTIAPIGRASFKEDLQIDGEQIRYLMEFIAQTRLEKQIDIKLSCEAYVGEYEKKVRDAHFFCRAGINIASVLIDGSISACPNINRHFVQGNIYHDDFLDVWENRFQIMRDRKWTKTGTCANCKEYNNCNGGALHLWDENKDCILKCLHQEIESAIVLV
jgi:radical SAM enzyme (rSAM/lipoprotein system)